MAKRHILVIEDERAIADNVLYAFASEGFEVSWMPTAREGLAAFSQGGCDLIVLDVGLPDMNGFDVCREVRKVASTPVIFLTARAEEVDRIVGLELGGDDYLAKPFSPRELVARAKAVLRRTSSNDVSVKKTPPAPTNPFQIDAERHAIFYLEHQLDLSRYEFNLLELLIRRPGWVYTREQIMGLVWPDPAASMARTVDAHVKLLRAKLKAVRPDIDPIITHRGIGYSLKENW